MTDTDSLAAALIAAQTELPAAIAKDSTGQIGTRQYAYLSLDKLIAETRPILHAHGLTITQHPTMVPREGWVDRDGVTHESGYQPALTTILRHESGQAWQDTMPLYLATKDMQGLGSAITYARRYAWQSVLGIAAEEDTDATDEIPF